MSRCTQTRFAAHKNSPSSSACGFSYLRPYRRSLRLQSTIDQTAPVTQHPSDPQSLQSEFLVQARVGYGSRGRGLFYHPQPLVAQPATTATASTSGASAPPGQGPLFQPQPRPLLRVPLSAGLPVVVRGGPVELQRQLLAEWQSYNGQRIPETLVTLLEATDRPAALRLAAWLLWATQHRPSPSSPTASPDPAPPPGPSTTTTNTPAQPDPDGPTGHPHPLGGVSGAPFLADYAVRVLPSMSASGSCLRLAEADEERLPGDVRRALGAMREQVLSYCRELRRLGLDSGCDDARLWWAFDMIISRSFTAEAHQPPNPPSTSTSAATSWSPPTPAPPPAPPPSGSTPASISTPAIRLALYCPWACLLNHAPEPNASFLVDLPSREFLVMTAVRMSYFPVHVEPGEELCISYGDDLDNGQLLLRYGFCTAGNTNDRVAVPPEVAAAVRGLPRQVLCSAAEEVTDAGPQETSREGSPAAAADTADQQRTDDEERRRRRQHRTRVYGALALLLEPPAVWEPGLPSSGETIRHLHGNTVTRATTTAQASSMDMNNPATGAGPSRVPQEATPVATSVPKSALLPADPFLSASIDTLRAERRLLLQAMNDIICKCK